MPERTVRAALMVLVLIVLFPAGGSAQEQRTTFRLSFAPGKAARGYIQVTPDMRYDKERGFGFEPGARLRAIDRGGADALRGGFVTAFGSRKSDPVEAHAAARFAIAERPRSDKPLSLEPPVLRQVAGRLQAVVRQRTRLINQLHHLLALTFPELALLTKDVAAGWTLELLHRYPSAAALAQATPAALQAIPYLPDDLVAPLLQHAQTAIAALTAAAIDELLRDQVRQLRDSTARQKRLESLLVCAYHALPQANHLDSIPGIGAVTAAVLTAFRVDIDRFATPAKLVAYFGVLPIEASSGVNRDLWSALHGMSLREAALDLVRNFGLQACAQPGTEKRNG